MNPSKLDVSRGRIRAAAGGAILAVLSTLVSTLVAPRAMGQCTLTSAVNFGAGNAPGTPIPTSGSTFRSGYENDVPVYTTSTGARRLLLMFNYGYGVMDLSNPGNPSAMDYEDMLGTIPPRGDGQNYIWSMGVAPDGARAVFSLGPQASPFKAAVGTGSSQAFYLKGDFSAGAATGGTVVQKTSDGRYIAYVLLSRLVAANITTLPTGTLTAGSMTSEATAFPGGTPSTLQLAGNYLSYLAGTSVLILDASNPGSKPPNITSGFTQTKLSLADFGRSSGSPVTLATALDPSDSSALYVLVEFAGSGFGLVRVQGSTKTLIGSFPIPTVSGETWDTGYTSALITGGSNVWVFMWATRTSPSPLYRLYSTTVSNFGSTPGAIDLDPSVYAFFATGHPMRGFASADGTVNAYMGTSATAYALSLACASVTASNGGPVCAGTPLTLSSTGPPSATYAWSGPNGFTAAVQNPTIATPTTAATGVYQVTRTNQGTTTTAQTAATVLPPPVVPTAGNNGPLCPGQALALTAATVSGAAYGWTGPNGYTSSLQNPTISSVTTAAAGTYTVTATVNGCSSSASTGVTVNAPPPAPAAGNNGPLCAGGTLALTASTIANAAYAWTGPNGFTSASQNPSIPNATPAAGGVYSVTATVNGCTGPAGSTTLVVIGPSALITAPPRICLAAGNTGTASVQDAGVGAAYIWAIANGAITGGQGTPVISFSVTGTGTTTLGVTVTAGGCGPNGSATIPVQTQCGFSTLIPCRAVDTRNVSGPPFQANGLRSFDLLLSGCGVPPTAKAVSANLTVVSPTATGALHAYPGDLGTAPSATAISFSSGRTRANNVILPLATDGSGTVAILNDSGGALDLIIDINGYFE
jgi:hypothetical protein